MTPTNRAYAMAERIAAIDCTGPSENWVPEIVNAIGGDHVAWQIYDETMWREKNFWAARSIRNSFRYAPTLFDSFKARANG